MSSDHQRWLDTFFRTLSVEGEKNSVQYVSTQQEAFYFSVSDFLSLSLRIFILLAGLSN